MVKIVRLGTGPDGNVYCRIKYTEGRLSIKGVEGPKANGGCRGACGQIVMHLKGCPESISPAPGWNTATIARFFDTWDRWHLNDEREGTPAQEAYLREHPVAGNSLNHYTRACEALAAVGLNPDGGYKYGSAWLREDVPQDVLDWLFSLPDADRTPAWV